MNILLVADKPQTAIHRLCLYTQMALPQHNFKIVFIHPKRHTQEQFDAYDAGYEWADLIDFRYWKSAELMRSVGRIGKPMILTHYNPYDLKASDWTAYDRNLVVNTEQAKELRLANVIPLPVDIQFFAMQDQKDFTEDRCKTAIMVANRIEGKKGVLEAAQACQQVGMKFILVGRPSDGEYLQKILANSCVEFHEGVSDQELKELYYKSGIHICNSVDGFESGTMPILESMACGVPVVTRKVGHVPDLNNGTNMIINPNATQDVPSLAKILSDVTTDLKWLLKVRQEAWATVKSRNIELYGRQYNKIYQEVLYKDDEVVSVIIPTADRPKALTQLLLNLNFKQPKFLEVIVCDDGETDDAAKVVQAYRESTNMTIKYFKTATYRVRAHTGEMIKTYGLAHARNKGAMEAQGKWLLFLDDRLVPVENAIMAFYLHRKENSWLWGTKNKFRKGFVENFSFVNRHSFLKLGGFSEQITQYGGLTQEVRTRYESLGMKFVFCEEADAEVSTKSRSRWTKYLDIAKSKTQCYKLNEG